MYPQFFGLEKLPFRLRPDPQFLYSGKEYLRARAKIVDELSGTSRMVLLTGPPGVGKTTLLEDLLAEIAGRFAVCLINQPRISPAELVQALLLQLGALHLDADAENAPSFGELIPTLDAVAARDAAPLIVIDDAHLLAGGTLRSFRAILARAPRLKVLLALQSGRQLRADSLTSRMGIPELPREVQLRPLSAHATQSYVERRLAVAGRSGQELFTPDAHAMIYQHTAGSARLVNVLCDAALHAACTRACGHVGAAEILAATEDSRWPEAVARDRPVVDAPGEVLKDACAELLVSRGSDLLATWPLKNGRIGIGRASDNEVQLEAPYISRHHCRVVTVGYVSTIEDLGSVNGLCVNGKTVRQHVLQPNDEVSLGQHRLTYRMS